MRSLLIAVLLTFGAKGAMAELLSLSTLSDYFNAMQTVEAPFRQINDDGSVSTGKVYIKRPGRMRFEYDPPNDALVIARSSAVVIIDKKSNQPPETYPLRRTPLALILARNVDLTQARMVVGHGLDGDATIVTAQDPKNPEYGTIEMRFSATPVELTEWVVRTDEGGTTKVVLGPLTKGRNLSSDLFDVDEYRRGEDR
ncbi:MAG: outer membrane lipoprotein carrier protein LolA [Pseudomonadota bacterium]